MEDRISSLSDGVLCHILSFLSTEEAVATSVLSKRWRPLWKSVPVLDYDDEIYLRNDRPASCFERLVYGTILARDVLPRITRFRLKYGLYASELPLEDVSHCRSNADVNVWVNTAVQRGIENLDIEMYPQNYMVSLSGCNFSCRTLVVLKLRGLSLSPCSSVDLPSLKFLDLKYIKFVEPKYLMEFLHGCPMLEDMQIRYMDYAHDGSFHKEGFKIFPKLVRADLRFVGMDDTDILLKALRNVESLCINQFHTDIVVPEFPHVKRLGFFLVTHSWHSVLKMFKNCPNLQSFKMYLNQSVAIAEYVLSDPHFAVPECLTSAFSKCYITYYPGSESALLFAKYIMQNSTSLQSMRVRIISDADPLTQEEMVKELTLCPRRSASCELSVTLGRNHNASTSAGT